MKLEIGGGTRNVAGYINLDQCESADIRHDLNVFPWPIADDSVNEVYSSHCLEHVHSPNLFLAEICRIGRLEASVIIRVPDAMSESAMVPGHTCVMGEVAFRNLLQHFPEMFPHPTHILAIEGINRRSDVTWFPRARSSRLFQHYSDEEIMMWVPRTCHEIEVLLRVKAR